MELKGKKINFLGDSITEGAGASENALCYVSQVASKSGAICRNYGIGGTRFAKQINPTPWDSDFCSRVEGMDEDADIVCVFGGTNDFGHGDAPLGEFTDRTNDTFYGATHVLCTKLIEKYHGKLIVFFTPLHRLNEDSLVGDGKPEPVGNLKTYVDIIRQVTEYYSLPVLDLYAESGFQPKIPVIQEKYMPDGLHPSNKGHEILAEKIIAYLEKF